MPIYEYRCAACGFQREYLQRLTDPILSVCPECGSPAFKKLVTAAGFQLKGSGWYATDFKNGGAAAKKKDEHARKDGGEKKDGESKPAENASASCGAGGCPACS